MWETIVLGVALVGVLSFAVIHYRGRHDAHRGPGARGSDYEKAGAEAKAWENHWPQS